MADGAAGEGHGGDRARLGADPIGSDPAAAGERGLIWPPADQEAPPDADPSPSAVAEQFPALDPELLTRSLAVTSSAPPAVRASAADVLAELWRNWLRTRYPLVLVSVLLAVLSLPRIVASVVQVTSAFPVVGTAALVLWALYAFPLIWLIMRVDFFEREPNALVAMALAWGGVIATSMAVTANQALFSLLTSAFGEAFTARWGAALAAPVTEESLKALGIVAVVLLARRRIRSAVDGFVVGATVGVGFQVVENFVYTGNLLLAAGQESPMRTVLDVLVVRGVGTGLWSHAVYSGVAGMGIGYALTRHDRSRGRRVFVAAAMLGLAWFLHLVWNLPDLVAGMNTLSVLVKAAIILGMLGLVLHRNRGRESYIFTEYLESVHDPAIITGEEIEQLRTYRSREAAARAAARTGGERAAAAVRRLQRRQADLSVAMATADLERMAQARRGIAAARAAISSGALLPEEVGHRWGVASIWMSILGILIPIAGPVVALVLASLGTRQARSRGAELARSLRLAWALAGASLVIGVAEVALLLE